MNTEGRAARGYITGCILNAMHDDVLNVDEIVSKTRLTRQQVAVTLFRLSQDGRVREARREGRTVYYRRVPAAERMTVVAQNLAAKDPVEVFNKLREELDKAMLVVGEISAENGRLRAENELLRRTHKDLAAKL